jgi:hypothetical protein
MVAGARYIRGVSEHRYARQALTGDFVRSVTGLAITVGPILLAQPGTLMMAVLGVLAALFATHGVRTWVKSATRIEIGDEGVAVRGPRNATLRWDGLRHMSLTYYSTRRDGSKGWMQMKLEGVDATLRIDSTLEGFPALARRVAAEAAKRGLELPDATQANLAALGRVTGRDIWPTS